MDERNITVDGQQIAFTQSGGSGRPVIFVHGNSSSAPGAFAELLEQFIADLS